MYQPNAAAVWIKTLVWLALVWPALSQAGIYRWTDADGRVHFSDQPRQGAETVTLQQSPQSRWQPMAIEVQQIGEFSAQDSLDIARIQREVNWVYRFYADVLYFDFLKNVPVNIAFLPTQQEYLHYVRATADVDASNSKGIYLGRQHRIAVFLHPKKWGGLESSYATIRHEVSHAILHALAGRMPAWLNEGMAEQMETISRPDDAFVVTAHQENRRSYLRSAGQAMPVLEFVEVRSDRWRSANYHSGINQSMSGQLVYMLLSTPYGRSLITRLLQDYKRGVNLRAYYLLDEHYIGGATALDIHWKNWVAAGMAAPARIELR